MELGYMRLIFRPAPAPSPRVLLGARSVGHNLLRPRFQSRILARPFVELFWGVRGTGVLVLEGVERRLGPDQVAVYFPGMVHNLRALDEPWEYRFWTMDGPEAAAIVSSAGLAAAVFDAGPAPADIFRRLEKAMVHPSRRAEIRASAAAYELLILAASGRLHREDFLVTDAAALIRRRWRDPSLNVNALADALACHRSILSRRFTRALGLSPSAYLARLRVQRALSLLALRRQSVAAVAAACGFADPNYFSRVIRRTTGMPPDRLRRTAGGGA